MTYITTRSGVQLYTKVWGSGRPIILLHGWPLSADSWDAVAMSLADAGFQSIAYDRRGFGRSSQPWQGYDYDTLADDLADVIKELKLGNITLVGFSMGGGEVARYMSRYEGESLRSVALLSSIVPYMLASDTNPNGVPQAIFDEMAKGLYKDRASFFSAFFNDFYGVDALKHAVSEELLQWSRSVAMQASLKATLACAKSFATTDFRADLASFNLPTLIVHGTADKTVPIDATARPAAKAIKGAKLIEYDGAPHGIIATHQQTLIDDLLDFCKR